MILCTVPVVGGVWNASTTDPHIFHWLSSITCEGWAARVPPGTAAWQGIFFQAIYSASHYRVTNRAKLTRKESSLLLSLLSRELYLLLKPYFWTHFLLWKCCQCGAAPLPWKRLWGCSTRRLQKKQIVLLESYCICDYKAWRYFFCPTLGGTGKTEKTKGVEKWHPLWEFPYRD